VPPFTGNQYWQDQQVQALQGLGLHFLILPMSIAARPNAGLPAGVSLSPVGVPCRTRASLLAQDKAWQQQ
jgi:hypothetical protein